MNELDQWKFMRHELLFASLKKMKSRTFWYQYLSNDIWAIK